MLLLMEPSVINIPNFLTYRGRNSGLIPVEIDSLLDSPLWKAAADSSFLKLSAAFLWGVQCSSALGASRMYLTSA